jgi:hypothetical protein
VGLGIGEGSGSVELLAVGGEGVDGDELLVVVCEGVSGDKLLASGNQNLFGISMMMGHHMSNWRSCSHPTCWQRPPCSEGPAWGQSRGSLARADRSGSSHGAAGWAWPRSGGDWLRLGCLQGKKRGRWLGSSYVYTFLADLVNPGRQEWMLHLLARSTL